MEKVVKLFTELVKIDSPSGEEKPMAEFLNKWLVDHGFNPKTDDNKNIFANNNANGEPLLFCAHMDTVEPGKGIVPRIENEIIKSNGKTILGADNKAAIAALLIAIEKYQETKKIPMIELLFTVKEETDSGIMNFPFQWIKSKSGVIFDYAQPLGGIVMRSPYISNFKIKLIGKAAHAAIPEKGVNATIPAFLALNQIPVGKVDGDGTTVNIGLIKGGSGINTVPAEITIEGEVRSYSNKVHDLQLKNIGQIFQKHVDKAGVKMTISFSGYSPGYIHDNTDSFIKKLKTVLMENRLTPVEYQYSAISDANLLIANGIKIVNLTDGVINPHTVQESITVENLNKLTNIIHSLISRQASRAG